MGPRTDECSDHDHDRVEPTVRGNLKRSRCTLYGAVCIIAATFERLEPDS